MFRPMALTMACALFGRAGLLGRLLSRRAASLLVPPRRTGTGRAGSSGSAARYARSCPARRARAGRCSAASARAAGRLGAGSSAARGAEFVPRIFEGDAVVTIRRAPSISLDEARELDLATEKVLHGFPEVVTTLGMTGRAEVAIDPVGNDNTDIFVRLRRSKTGRRARDFDDLSVRHQGRASRSASRARSSRCRSPSRTRPTSSSAARAPTCRSRSSETDLERAVALGRATSRETVREHPRHRRRPRRAHPRASRCISAVADRQRMARYGVRVEDAFTVLRRAARASDRQRLRGSAALRVSVCSSRLRPRPPEALGDLFVETDGRQRAAARRADALSEDDGPASDPPEYRAAVPYASTSTSAGAIFSLGRRGAGDRRAKIRLPVGYRIEWGGQFENFERAQKRLRRRHPRRDRRSSSACCSGCSRRPAGARRLPAGAALADRRHARAARSRHAVQLAGGGRLHRAGRHRRAQRRRDGAGGAAAARARRAAREGGVGGRVSRWCARCSPPLRSRLSGFSPWPSRGAPAPRSSVPWPPQWRLGSRLARSPPSWCFRAF